MKIEIKHGDRIIARLCGSLTVSYDSCVGESGPRRILTTTCQGSLLVSSKSLVNLNSCFNFNV
jgi:hypothetical protein